MNEDQKGARGAAEDGLAKIAPMFGTVGGGENAPQDQKPSSLEFAPRIPSSEDVAEMTAPGTLRENADAFAKEGIILEERRTEPVRDPLFAARILEQERGALRTHASPEERDPLPSFEIAGGEEEHLPKIRTYRSDVASALKQEKTSVIQMVLAEHEKKSEAEEQSSPAQPKNLALVIISVALVALGLGLAGFAAWRYVNNQRVTAKEESAAVAVPSLIFVEEKKGVDITGLTADRVARAIAGEIAAARNRLDTIVQIYPVRAVAGTSESPGNTAVQALVSTSDFWDALDSGMPESLVRALSANFLIGVHVFNGNQPFIILRADYFESAFAGMLRWEKTLAHDVLPLFGVPLTPEILTASFEDIVIRNQDYRALRDANGNIILLYRFHDKSTIIIATADETVKEVVDRLNRGTQ